MRTDFNSVWVVTQKSRYPGISEDDVIFFDHDDAIFYCEEKNQEDYDKCKDKERYIRPFSVQTLYESMSCVMEYAEKNGYDEGYENGYDVGKERGYDDGYDEGRRESN